MRTRKHCDVLATCALYFRLERFETLPWAFCSSASAEHTHYISMIKACEAWNESTLAFPRRKSCFSPGNDLTLSRGRQIQLITRLANDAMLCDLLFISWRCKVCLYPPQRTSRFASSRTPGRGRALSPRPMSTGRWPLCSAHHRTATLTSRSQSESRCSFAGHPTVRSASLWTSSTCLLTQVRRRQPVSYSVRNLWSSPASHQYSKSIPCRWVQAEWEEKAYWGHVPEPEAGACAVEWWVHQLCFTLSLRDNIL